MVDPQFQMFDESPREEEMGTLSAEGERWSVVLEARECADRLVRGRFLFRSEDRQLHTADLFIDTTYRAVVERASGFREHLLRDLVRSLV